MPSVFLKRKFYFDVGKTRGCRVTNVLRRQDSEYYNGRYCTIYTRLIYSFLRWKWRKTTNVHTVPILLIQCHFFCFFAECPLVSEFLKFIEGFILRQFGITVKLYFTDILFGVQRSNTRKDFIKKINHVILTAKMCISTFRKQTSKQKQKKQDNNNNKNRARHFFWLWRLKISF